MAQSRSSSRLQRSFAALAASAALGTLVVAGSGLPVTARLVAAAADNTLSPQEQAAGWKLLFDGTSTKGWRNAHADKFPEKGWQVKDGLLTVVESGGGEATNGGDIVTVDEYGDFELKLDVRLTKGANSGIKYFVTEKLGTPGRGSAIGLEYQLLDDAVHPDAKMGREGNRTFGSLYDLMAAPAQADRRVEQRAHHQQGHEGRALAERHEAARVRSGQRRLQETGGDQQVQGLRRLRPGQERTHSAAGPRQQRVVPQRQGEGRGAAQHLSPYS